MVGILQNAFGNTAYVNQTNLNGKLRKKLGGTNGGQAKIWGGAWPTQAPPLRIATVSVPVAKCGGPCLLRIVSQQSARIEQQNTFPAA